jgi:phosphoglycerate dehydrogenase-like enzyme
MPRPRLLYFTSLEYQPENRDRLAQAFDVVERPVPGDESDTLCTTVDAACAPLGYRFDADRMDRFPRLRAILSNTTGVPHIDVAAAERRGIAVFSLVDEQPFLATITPTAEHAFGLMLALIRRTPWAFGSVLEGRWHRFDFGAPAMLSRLSLGIVGLGRLGRMMARYGDAFGMTVRYFDPNVDDRGFERAPTLGDLVASADVVSLHVPATEDTLRLVDAPVLSAFRRGSYLVNTARGELVDEEALLRALRSGHLAGAALDVLDGEYAPGFDAATHPLVHHARTHQNLLLTPHIGGSTVDAWRETQRRVIDRAIAHFAVAGQ